MKPRWPDSVAAPILLIVAGGMIILNILLLRQNGQLRAAISVLSVQLGDALDLSAGSLVPSLEGYDLQGNPIKVVHDSDDTRITLLLVFATTCGACDENWPTWRAILSDIAHDKVRVVAANLDGRLTDEYRHKHSINFPLLAEVEQTTRQAYRLRRTPQTIVIDPDGRVIGVWTGILKEQQISELEGLLSQQDVLTRRNEPPAVHMVDGSA